MSTSLHTHTPYAASAAATATATVPFDGIFTRKNVTQCILELNYICNSIWCPRRSWSLPCEVAHSTASHIRTRAQCNLTRITRLNVQFRIVDIFPRTEIGFWFLRCVHDRTCIVQYALCLLSWWNAAWPGASKTVSGADEFSSLFQDRFPPWFMCARANGKHFPLNLTWKVPFRFE